MVGINQWIMAGVMRKAPQAMPMMGTGSLYQAAMYGVHSETAGSFSMLEVVGS